MGAYWRRSCLLVSAVLLLLNVDARTAHPSQGLADPTGSDAFLLTHGSGHTLTQFDGLLYYLDLFQGRRGLGVSDGTRDGTREVPIEGATPQTSFSELKLVGDTLYLAGITDTDRGLWRSDGNSVRLVGRYGRAPSQLTNVQGTLYFVAESDPQNPSLSGVWRSDGTPEGTILLRSFISQVPWPVVEAHHGDKVVEVTFTGPGGFTELNGTLFFYAYTQETGIGLWKTDGTPAGTVFVQTLVPKVGPGKGQVQAIVAAESRLFLLITNWLDHATLLASDGAGHLTPLKEFSFGGGRFGPSEVVVLGSQIVFCADGEGGRELWASDGTATGTRRISDIRGGPVGSDPQRLLVTQDRVFFTADDGVNGREVWTSDTTAAGTRRVTDLPGSAPGDQAMMLAPYSGGVAFTPYQTGLGRELWWTDGTFAGTRLLADINKGPDSSNPYFGAVVGDTLYFTADGGTAGVGIWGYDGTPPRPYLTLPSVVGGRAAGVADVPVTLGNGSATTITGTLTLSVTVDDRLTYEGDTFGAAPTQQGNTLVWQLPIPAARRVQDAAVRFKLPDAPLGTRFPLHYEYGTPNGAGVVVQQGQTDVMVARQIFLPLAVRQ
jgi:ELWxxDGT repeat protein